jgi:metallophosphoesterase superfamily enzyme
VVITLGDNFHDGGGPCASLGEQSRASLTALQRGRDWIWITGNHDPDPAEGIGGSFAALRSPSASLRSATSRSDDAPDGEIAGHLHPVARIVQRGPRGEPALLRNRWPLAGDAGLRRLHRGLNVRDRAFSSVFGARKFTAPYAGRQSALCFCGVALPFGLSAPGP